MKFYVCLSVILLFVSSCGSNRVSIVHAHKSGTVTHDQIYKEVYVEMNDFIETG